MLAGKAGDLRLHPPTLIWFCCPWGYFLCLSVKFSTLRTRCPSPPQTAGWDTESPDQALQLQIPTLPLCSQGALAKLPRLSEPHSSHLRHENYDRTYTEMAAKALSQAGDLVTCSNCWLLLSWGGRGTLFFQQSPEAPTAPWGTLSEERHPPCTFPRLAAYPALPSAPGTAPPASGAPGTCLRGLSG